MDSFNHQATIKKMWNVNENGGTIKIKQVRCKSFDCKKCPHLFYAYYKTCFFGKYLYKYLGKCDSLGRPLIARKMATDRSTR